MLFNLSILLFLNLLKELIIDCLDINANKIEVISKKISLKILKDADLFCYITRTLLRYFKITVELKDSKSRILSR